MRSKSILLNIVFILSVFVVIGSVFFLWDRRYNHSKQYQFKLSKFLHESMRQNLTTSERDQIFQNLQILVPDDNGELKKLILISNYQNFSDAEAYIDSLNSVIKDTKFSDITTSFARICFVSFILNQGTKTIEVYRPNIIEYLDYFQNQQQLYFNIATLLKSNFYYIQEDWSSAKAHARILLNIENISEFIQDQARVIFIRASANL